jgi:hypothetical protein
MDPDPIPQSEPGTGAQLVRVPEPGIRFRVLYALWVNAADWRTRESLLRAAALIAWRRATTRRR